MKGRELIKRILDNEAEDAEIVIPLGTFDVGVPFALRVTTTENGKPVAADLLCHRGKRVE